MLTLAGTVLQFTRLERVEVGGTKGKNITAAIKTAHADFIAAHERFQQVRHSSYLGIKAGRGALDTVSRYPRVNCLTGCYG